MCVLCWDQWHEAQPRVAPECTCSKFACRHFWIHSCYHDSFLERQWSENRQRKSSPLAATRGRQSELDEFMERVAVDQVMIRYRLARLRRASWIAPTTQEPLYSID